MKTDHTPTSPRPFTELNNYLLATFLLLTACTTDEWTPPKQLGDNAGATIADSVQIGNITLYNSFKHQLAAFQEDGVDSNLIVNKVYHRHQTLWDDCYGLIFGSENAHLFQTDTGMVSWHRDLFATQEREIDSLSKIITAYNVDSLFNFHADRFVELGYDLPAARISFAFTLLQGIGFGGCANDQFVLELNNPEFKLIYTLVSTIR